MDVETFVAETETLLKILRQELKDWEASFFTSHKRKAGREDIKQHPEISEKYKRYNDLRYPSSKVSQTKVATPSKKRPPPTSSHTVATTATPTKRAKTAHALHPSTIDPYDAPVSSHYSPITHRTAIGPTPQKDGMVLGLFDSLSGSQSKTPSKRISPLVAGAERIQDTPSKHPPFPVSQTECVSTGERYHKSPLGTSKNPNLDNYQTPSACRIIRNTTPGSRGNVSKLHFDDTPAFLRRDRQRIFAGKENVGLDEDILWSPIAPRKVPKLYAGRGLSTLVKGLRHMEEEKMDEELDLLREMEEGDAPAKKTNQPKILVEDSQRPDMPLGPDGGLGTDDDETLKDEGSGGDGKPLKIWKKKGQKRTTRRVAMKPNSAKWKPEPAWKGEDESEDEREELIVEESQVRVQRPDDANQNPHEESDSWMETEEGGDPKMKPKIRAEGKKDGFATKIKKKIKATAHANFRALKIKNKQSKGKRGGGSKRKR